ncbi:hypothetical protein M899_2472 [Bacteriovorax sp. BSW11_IV]|uniref:hypothetical protein n=1 Tax=Bacteriovorax sp. BSW11_IV TaxID=1353529 RepID=UPI00038A4FE8|nr:hypothetical protein [Bacteriovorax sp. BSW11_IV]EQC44588.1 hypothetical protein M899_2472 [Bacteriovorax sp. BSW11_IV]
MDTANIENTNNNEQTDRPLYLKVINLIEDLIVPFVSSNNEVFVDWLENGFTKTYHIDSPDLKRTLQSISFNDLNKLLRDDSYRMVKDYLCAKAYISGIQLPVHLRTHYDGENIYYNLANSSAEIVKISSTGWIIEQNSDVKFHKTRNMLSNVNPSPQGTGDLNLLKKYINYSSNEQWYLIATWLLSTCYRKPYVVLLFIGQQGTAKSSSSKNLIEVVDPCLAPLNSKPRKEQDVFISASSRHLLGYDNISGINAHVSDLLCRISTGAGLELRRLHTDSEQTVFNTANPMILNGITDFANRGDLMSRAIFIELPVIPPNERKTDLELTNAFQEDLPKILSGAFDCLSIALKNIDSIKLTDKPRMADFAVFGCAVSEALGITQEDFMMAYNKNIIESNKKTLELDPVAISIKNFLLNAPEHLWEGTMTDLLVQLDAYLPENLKRINEVPTTPAALSNTISRLAPMLEISGIGVRRGRNANVRFCKLFIINNDDNDVNDA